MELYLPEAHSLKEKRGVIKSIIQRIRNKFNVSVCEADHHDIWKSATIGMAAVSNDKDVIEQTFSAIDRFLEDYCDCQVVSFEVEIL